MSRVGKQQLTIPDKVEVKLESLVNAEGEKSLKVRVEGPLGTVAKVFPDTMNVKIDGKTLTCEPVSTAGDQASLWGTSTAHLANMLEGVTKGFQKKLIIEGIGYRAELSGTTIVFALGFSHPVKIPIPKDIKVTIEKNVMTITGADKDAVGQFAAIIVAHKKPEPYKGKGILYEGQVIKRKQGKRSTT